MKENNSKLNYDEYILEKKDQFEFLLMATIRLMKWKILKFIFYLDLCFQAILELLATIFFFIGFDVNFFMEKAPIYFGSFYALTTIYYSITKLKDLQRLVKDCEIVSRDMTDMSDSTKSAIYKWKWHSHFYCTFSMFFALITSIFYTPLTGTNEDMFFAIWFFNIYVKPYNYKLFQGLRIMYYLSYVHLALTMSAQNIMFMYYCLKLIVLNLMLAELIQNINSLKFLNKNRLDIVDNEKYQERISKKLKYCIQMHQKIKNLSSSILNKIVKEVQIVYTISGIVMGVSIIICHLTHGTVDTYPRVILVGSVYSLSVITISILGQQLINSSELIWNRAFDQNWYYWNKKNRQLFLIFLQNCKEPIKFTSIGKVIDHSLIIFVSISIVIQSIYSITTGFIKIRNKMRKT